MVSALVLYEQEPDPQRYAQHVALCKKVPDADFVHGKVFGAATGEPQYAYFAEFRFPDRDAFKAALAGPEFAATGKDGRELGVPFTVHFAGTD